MSTPFVHLHLHTEYSVVDGLIRIKPLLQQVKAENMPAVALTDQSNLFAMVKFYRQALACGIKPIIGSDVWIEGHGDPRDRSRLCLYCQDMEGFRNLSRLITKSYIEGQSEGIPYIHFDWLKDHHQGLIALSGGQEGDLGKALLAGETERARGLLDDWRAIYPDRFYLELQRVGKIDEENYINEAVDLAAATGVPVVATNNVRFLSRKDFDAHEARVCIHDSRTLADPRRPKNYTDQQYLRSSVEMAELFDDLPEALENTLEIAIRCNLELELGKYFLPDFPVPEGVQLNDHFVELSKQGMEQRLSKLFDRDADGFAEQRRVYDERLQIELDVIIGMGFPGYFLIVADFIAWAKENAIPVGPGRGSGAGSLVAYALKITDLDPIAYELLFERFLNPERVSMPDFDIDFCMDRRDEVIEYVGQRYGKDRVSQIITYGSMTAKAVVRDTGRVLGQPYGLVDQIAKLIPFEIGITLEKALQQEEALRSRYENEEEVQTLIELAMKLEGLTRNAGKHAGGVVIAPSPLTDFTALYCEQGATTAVTQFDMSDVEGVGLVKFDFLGLRTLTIIDWAVRDINILKRSKGEPDLDISSIPLDDRKTYALVMRADTTAVFQLESPGMKDLIKRLRPDTFADMIALVALFRPGPLQSGMVDDYVDRKHGKKFEYPHPELVSILKPTYGTILYQEQVMQIAQVLAGYSLGGADLLRRAMGKKKPEEMAKQRAIFTDGAVQRGVNEGVATRIFDTMEKFAEYGFNKSHSAAYALVAYQTAWLKAHYPAAFMAAVLSSDMDNTDKVVGLYEECNQMKLKVELPNVNTSYYAFTVPDERTIRYGLGAIKGAGEAALQGIVQEREEHGPYTDLFDFCRRLDTRKVNKRVLDSLVRSGAMDELGPHRNAILSTLPEAIKRADQQSKNDQQGINDMFGLNADVNPESEGEIQYKEVDEWPDEDRLQGEMDTLGLYLTGHPFKRYETDLSKIISSRIKDVRIGTNYTVAGLLHSIRTRNSPRGKTLNITLDDGTARVDVTVYSEKVQLYSDKLVKGSVLVMKGKCVEDSFNDGKTIIAEHIMDVQQARESKATLLVIEMQSSNASRQNLEELHRLLQANSPGNCPVVIRYQRPEGCAELKLADAWRVRLPDHLLKQLEGCAGVDSIRLHY